MKSKQTARLLTFKIEAQMAGAEGLEPATADFGNQCSTN